MISDLAIFAVGLGVTILVFFALALAAVQRHHVTLAMERQRLQRVRVASDSYGGSASRART